MHGEGVFALGVFDAVCRLFGGGQLALRQAFEVFFVIDEEGVSVGGAEHVVAEFEGEGGELFVDFAEPGLLVGGHIGAAPFKIFVDDLQQPFLLVVEVLLVAVLVHFLDALEQLGVQHDVVAVTGEHREDGVGELFHFGTVHAFGEVHEDGGDLGQQFAAVLVGDDGVAEGGFLGVAADGLDFLLLLPYALLDGREVVGGFDLVEGRHAVGGVPLLHEGVVGQFGVLGRFFLARAAKDGGRQN